MPSLPATPPHARPAIYSRLLGAAWPGLPSPLRQTLEPPTSEPRHGTATVRRGSTLAARVVCWVLRLPAAGEGVPITLAVAPSGAGVQWRRSFGAVELCSEQLVENGELVERLFGRVECRFRLAADDGTVLFHQTSTTVTAGSLRIPVPRWLAPRVTGATRAVSGSRVHAEVSITLPIGGLLLDYANEIDVGQ